MNYRHGFHAGGAVDVFKHNIFLELIRSFLRKENPFVILDTHAGAGHYDLFSEASQKNQEYKTGIFKVLQHKNLPPQIKQYLNCVQRINNKLSQSAIASLRYYPGSPAIARYFMRNQDRLILTDLHPHEIQTLKNSFQNDKQVSVHLLDGFNGLKAFLPPKERRGFIFIDPPYEKPDEYAQIATTLPTAVKRFPTGTFAIWYPIKDVKFNQVFLKTLKEAIKNPMLVIELFHHPEALPTHLNGSGIVIINPPWQMDINVKKFLPWLCKALSAHQQGHFKIFSLQK